MYPILLNLSGHKLSSWVLMMVIGSWAGYFSCRADLLKRKISLMEFQILAVGVFVIWFLGANLGQKITVGNGSIDLLQVKVSGLMLYGGLVACFMFGGLYWFFMGWQKKILIQELWDVAALALAWVFLFGRLGCTLYGCCYGTPSGDWPGYVLNYEHWDHQSVPFPMQLRGISLHPAPFYEAVGFLFIILITYWMRSREKMGSRRIPPGVLGWFCWISYGIIRFLIEMIRLDPRGQGMYGLSPSQCFAVLFVGFGMVLLPWEMKKARVPIYLRESPSPKKSRL